MNDNSLNIAIGCLALSIGFCVLGWGSGLALRWDEVTESISWLGSSGAGTAVANEMASDVSSDASVAVCLRQPQSALEAFQTIDELIQKGGLGETEFGQGFQRAKKQGKQVLGFDITDSEGWKSTGLSLDDPIMAAVFSDEQARTRGVLVQAIVSKKSKFEDFLVKLSDADSAETANAGGHELKKIGELLVAYRGDRAFLFAIVRPGTDAQKLFAEHLESPAEGESLAAQDGYRAFEKALLNDQILAAYLNPESPAAESMYKQAKAGLQEQPVDAETVDEMKSRVRGLGFGSSFDTESLAMEHRGWIGLDSTGRKAIEDLLAPEKTISWSNFTTDQALGALRLSIRPDGVWTYTKDALSSEGEKQLDGASKAVSRQAGTDFDVERDLVGKLSGDAGAVVYDIEGMFGEDGGVDWTGLLSVKFIGLLQFKSQKALTDLVVKAKKALKNVPMELEPDFRRLETSEGETVESIGVVEFKNPMIPKFYARGGLLAVAPTKIGEGAMHSYLEGSRADASLADAEGVVLGEKFAKQDRVNGFYVNYDRINESVGEKLSGNEQVKKFLALWREMAIQGYVGDDGFYLDADARLDDVTAN